MAEGYEEHHVVDGLMGELKAMQPGSEQYEAKLKVLMENVEHHIEEEEGEMFPSAQRTLGDAVERLGTEMVQRKEKLMSAMR